MARRAVFLLSLLVAAPFVGAQPAEPTMQELLEQNRRLEAQVREQQRLIESLGGQVSDVLKASARQEEAIRGLQERADAPPDAGAPERPLAQEIRLSAEAGLAFFRTGPAGQFPNSEFRVDDAKVFLEAPVWRRTYFFGEFDITTREAGDEAFHAGELYLDFEDVPTPWAPEHLLNLRLGRFYIPFGEEYQVRNVMDNPLISHSIADPWGVDEGIEAYGGVGGLHYVVAVQNGGDKALHDGLPDKAVAARVGYDPARWLHLSASAMRTGDLSASGDGTSALWFGGGFFRALGAAATTQRFHASLAELDATVRWKEGRLDTAFGGARFGDSDRTADDTRHLSYYQVGAMQQLGGGFFVAARYSRLRAPGGYPLVGQGDFGTYFFRSPLTEQLERRSIGMGYRFGPPLVWKAEYNIESGRLSTGAPRDREDLLATEIGLRF